VAGCGYGSGMVGIAVMPAVNIGDLAPYVKNTASDSAVKSAAELEAMIGAAIILDYLEVGLLALGPIGWVGFACAVAGTY